MSDKYCPRVGTCSPLHTCSSCEGSSKKLTSQESSRLESLINSPGALSASQEAEGNRLYNQKRRSSR